MTVMHRRDFPLDGSRPALLITYGGYGQCLDTDFDVGRLVMMENGWAVILCHVRGGGELGGRWHAAGRGAHKLNSVYDLAACVRWVSSSGLSSAPKIALHTASAGGLVVGAFLNMFQGLVGAAVVKVPFVDVANTMLDPSLPLTVHEYDEWGNTREPAVAAFLRSYSPYDNVKHGHAYPSLYITGAFNDTRVAYWEPGALPHLLRPLTVRQYIKS
jgi:oligopeptidase B